MDATKKQNYRTHFVMNTPRHGRELTMWVLRLPENFSLGGFDLGPMSREMLKTVDSIDRSVPPRWIVEDQKQFPGKRK